SVDETLRHLERLRQAIEESEFLVRAPDRPLKKPAAAAPVLRASKTLHITISIGAAEPTRRAATPNQVLDAADTALFRAKQAGRNRVVV
ncbi:MAG: diguanylate cyclase, partial [Candidatus Rokubacteria bacterium]|nr:diguanylate cyclase [Candidatus Rokubacteria bacterium]